MATFIVVVLLLFTMQELHGASTTNSTGERATDTLKFVAFVCRHGNRGASEDYPLDPYPLANSTYWPNGAQGLTWYGRLQAYNLGLKMRSLYNGFLPTLYSSSDFYATSDIVQRVITSGELVVDGLYDNQTITLHTDSPDNSVNVGMCQRKTTLTEKSWNAFLIKDASNISSLASYILNETSTNLTASDLYDMYEKVLSEDLEGYVLSDWVDYIYPSSLGDFYGKAFVAKNSGTNEVSRLYEGALLDQVIATMKSVMNGSSERLMTFYSGHDSTISNFQILLGVPRSSMVKIVKPGSAIIVELHENSTTSEYTVEVLYIDGTSSDLEPVSMSLKKCGSPCTYANFLTSTAAFQGLDFNAECSATDLTSTMSSSTVTTESSPSGMAMSSAGMSSAVKSTESSPSGMAMSSADMSSAVMSTESSPSGMATSSADMSSAVMSTESSPSGMAMSSAGMSSAVMSTEPRTTTEQSLSSAATPRVHSYASFMGFCWFSYMTLYKAMRKQTVI